MTIGQRIAERRKLLGISQEGLGEQMGVSRQAISKWEADGAIPEIDKLIALSKLFGVSVGWLLGTEDECEKTDSGQEVRLSDEQLKMVEQIVRRYQQAQPKRNPLMLICLICAVLALILSAVGLSKTPNQLSDLSYRLDQLEGETLLSEFEAEFTALPDWENAQVVFRAVPKQWQEGDTAYLILRQNGKERYQVPCVWDGVAFSAELEAAYGAYDSYFMLCRGDGAKKQQNVSEAFYGLPYELKPVCEIEVLEVGIDQDFEDFELGSLVMRLAPPWIMAQEDGLEWTKLDMVIRDYRDYEEEVRFNLLEICNITSAFVPDSTETETHNFREAYIRLERHVPVGIKYSGWLRNIYIEGQLSNGYTFREYVDWLSHGRE